MVYDVFGESIKLLFWPWHELVDGDGDGDGNGKL